MKNHFESIKNNYHPSQISIINFDTLCLHNISCDKVEQKILKQYVKEKVQFRCGMMFDLKVMAGIEIHQNGIYI